MKIRKVSILSNNIGYGLPPLPEDEVEQRLTITSNGRVWFTGYKYGNIYEKYEVNRKQQLNIGVTEAAKALYLFEEYFKSNPIILLATDIGMWDLKITETNLDEHKFIGSMCGCILIVNIDLTEYLRSIIKIEDLFVFG